MALKKLSLNEEQVDVLMELLSKKVSPPKIAKRVGVSHVTLWRNMVVLGVGVRRNRANNKSCGRPQYFKWKDFNNSLI